MAGFRGHLRGGAACAVAAAGLMVYKSPLDMMGIVLETIPNIGIVTSATMLGSLLPDIDHPESFLGRRMKLISRPIHHLFGHRSLTHSLFFIGAVSWLLLISGMEMAAIGLGIGMLSHVALDMLCLGDGVALLYPLYPHRIYLNINVYRRRLHKKIKKMIKKWMKKKRRKKK